MDARAEASNVSHNYSGSCVYLLDLVLNYAGASLLAWLGVALFVKYFISQNGHSDNLLLEKETIMNNTRRHKRYYLDLNDLMGKMSLSDKVEILDIGLGGIAFKADRRLNPGREYTIKLQDKGKTLNVSGTIVRSELKGIEARDDGKSVSIYAVGMQFKDGSADPVADFLKSIVQNRQETAPLPEERRLNVRFQITDLNKHILSYPANFNVKTISLSGMLIQTDQALGIDSNIPMELSLNDDTSVNFIGRIVSCHMKENKEQTHYDIGLEFANLTDKDKTLLQTFIDQWATMKNSIAREREQSESRT